MRVLQKAVLPVRERSWLEAGDDMLCGFVVDAADASWAKTTAQVHDVMGLGFPGSPLQASDAFVDVIRFAVPEFVRPVAAMGRVLSPDGFVDRPPFTGNGFSAARGGPVPVPVWWLDPVRVPAGTEMWRIHADGREEFRSVFDHSAGGWRGLSGPPRLAPSDVIGTFAVWEGRPVVADRLPDGRLVLTAGYEVAGLRRTDRGLWARTVAVDEVPAVFGLKVTCTWQGMPFQVVRRLSDGSGGVVLRLVYLGRDADQAESARLEKTDAGVYEVTVPDRGVTDLQYVQLQHIPE